MALKILYSPQFADSLEAILTFFDERNGSDRFSRKLMKMIHLFVERFGIEYQIRDSVILIIDIYSCQTNPDLRTFKKQG